MRCASSCSAVPLSYEQRNISPVSVITQPNGCCGSRRVPTWSCMRTHSSRWRCALAARARSVSVGFQSAQAVVRNPRDGRTSNGRSSAQRGASTQRPAILTRENFPIARGYLFARTVRLALTPLRRFALGALIARTRRRNSFVRGSRGAPKIFCGVPSSMRRPPSR